MIEEIDRTKSKNDIAENPFALGLIVTYEHLRKHFSPIIQHNYKTIYEYSHMEKADIGIYCLLLDKPGSSRWHHTYATICDVLVQCTSKFFSLEQKHIRLEVLFLIQRSIDGVVYQNDLHQTFKGGKGGG